MPKKPVIDDGFGDFDDGFGPPAKLEPLPEIKSPYWELPKKQKDASVDPDTILGEFVYRGRRVIHTTDKRFIHGAKTWGIQMPSGFVVRDDFDDYCLPVGEDVFFTPHEAIAAIEMMDVILPTIREGQFKKAESLEYAYREMRVHYRCYHAVHEAIKEIENTVFAAHKRDMNPTKDILKSLNTLRMYINNNRRVIHT